MVGLCFVLLILWSIEMIKFVEIVSNLFVDCNVVDCIEEGVECVK